MKMEVFNKNREAFIRRYEADLSEEYEKALQRGELDEQCMEFYNGLYSEAERAADESEYKTDLLNFIVGFGNGSFLEKLLSSEDKVSSFVVYEPDMASFLYLSTVKDISSLIADERLEIILIREGEENQVSEKVGNSVFQYNVAHIMIRTVPGYEDFYHEISEAFVSVVDKAINRCRVETASYRYHHELPCMNELYAMSRIAGNSTVSQLMSRIPDREIPVIIVAAGPSLDKNLDELEKCIGKALIIAVSRVSGKMRDKGINANLYAALDPANVGFIEPDNDMKVMVSAKADITVQKYCAGRCIYFDLSDGIFPIRECPEIDLAMESGGSVATYVFTLVIKAGFKKIILVGQDLAYGDNGATHAGGDERISGDLQGSIYVEGYYGGKVRSRTDWKAYLDYFASKIKNHPEVNVIDATEGGAYIKGTERISLSEAVERWCDKEYPVAEWLSDIPRFMSPEEGKLFGDKMMGLTESVERLAGKLRDVINTADLINSAMENGKNVKAVSGKVLNKYDSLYHEIMESSEGMILLYYCEDIIQDYIRDAVIFEKNGDVEGKIGLEKETFSRLAGKLPELISYMREFYF